MEGRKEFINAIITVIILLAIILVASENTSCEQDTVSVISHEGVINTIYKEPTWLYGHPKECTIKAYINTHYENVKEDAESFLEEFPTTSLLPFDFDIKMKREVYGKYENIQIIRYEYTGGAHGNVYYQNYNLKNKQDISFEKYLESIHFEKTKFLQEVNQRLKNDKYSTIEDFNHIPWYVSQRDDGSMGITIIFPPYTVASYAVGTIIYSF